MFTHDPLNREAREFRLVRFLPSDRGTEHISLELRHGFLDRDEYSALSYVWGDASDTLNITVNGETFPVGKRLHSALEQLNRNGISGWLWIDSICINQRDLEEKSWHTNDMAAVFSGAETVYMWLGLGSKHTDVVMDMISRVGREAVAAGALEYLNEEVHLSYDMYRKQLNSVASPSELGSSDVVHSGLSPLTRVMVPLLQEKGLYGQSPDHLTSERGGGYLLPGIVDILQREYWHRVWIFQEVALAKKGKVMCGEKTVLLDQFHAFFQILWDVPGKRTKCHLDPKQHGFFVPLSGTLWPTIKPFAIRNLRLLQLPVRLSDILVEHGAPPGRPYYSASDPRDIVFGLLGVIDSADKLGLRADYTRSLVDVFTTLTRSILCISEGRTLDEVVPKETNPDNLPTWVPDWRLIGRYGVPVFPVRYSTFFDASAGAPSAMPCEKFSRPAVLECLGCQVDVITEVMEPPEYFKIDEWGPTWPKSPNDFVSSVYHFVGLGPETGPAEDYVWRCVDWGELTPSRNAGNKGSCPTRMDEEIRCLMRILLRPGEVDLGGLTEKQIDYVKREVLRYSEVSSSTVSNGTLEYDVARVRLETRNYTACGFRGRTLFKTSKGMLGAGHKIVREGDMVTLLWGVPSPIILRPRDAAEGGFEFQGDAYVDGIMYGEFLDTKPAERLFEIY